jgi:hypothetical protein
VESINRRMVVQASPGINVRPYLKRSYSKNGWGMAQMVEQLPSKHEALSSNYSTIKPTTTSGMRTRGLGWSRKSPGKVVDILLGVEKSLSKSSVH